MLALRGPVPAGVSLQLCAVHVGLILFLQCGKPFAPGSLGSQKRIARSARIALEEWSAEMVVLEVRFCVGACGP